MFINFFKFEKEHSFSEYMKKGVVISWYVIALVLAIAVLALLGYLIFTYGGGFIGTLSEQECLAKKEFYCGLLKLGQPPDESWDEYAPGCSTNYNVVASETEC